MKNIDITPGQEVPVDIRLQVYKDAITYIGEQHYSGSPRSTALCLLLPCILWDLRTFICASPSGIEWVSEDTPEMFPEMTGDVIFNIQQMSSNYGGSYADAYRIEVLKLFIEQLEK